MSIGANSVVGVGSVVISNLPAGCLAAGAPARVIKENAYPAPLRGDAYESFWMQFASAHLFALRLSPGGDVILGDTVFMPAAQSISGPATEESERLRNQMRRYGIRFYARPVEGEYQPWT